jgi:hypothetical protein
MQVKAKSATAGLLIGILLSVMLLQAGCDQKTSTDSNPPPSANTLTGVSLSPRSFESADFTDFFHKANETGDVVSWAGDWNELAKTTDSAPKIVAELASTYDYVPMIELQFFTQSSGQLLRPLDATNKLSYKNSAVAFAGNHQPRYLGLGIEVNILYEKSPTDFDAFVSFYADVYDAVKAVSPDTEVFTVFQMERMKGLSGGLFGGVNDPNKAQWSLLDRFSKSDIIAFSTYPNLVYKNPEEIPDDYYSEIRAHTSKRIAFTEIGWHSSDSPSGWESSETEQAQFITKFTTLTAMMDMEMAIWSFMYDQNTFEPFNSMGLRRSDGSPRPAWDEWVGLG